MSLFSKILGGVKSFVRGAAKIAIPAAIATIPVIGPIASSVAKAGIAARGVAKQAGRFGRRGPVPARVVPGAGAGPVRRIQPVIGPVAGPAPTRFVTRPGTTTAPTGVQSMSIFAAIPPLIRTAAGAVSAASRTPAGRAVVVGTTAAAAADILLDEFGQPVRKKRRRMNYGNAKAARRAIRRIKGTRKLLQDIEKQLPRRAAPRPRRDLQPGHTHVR